MKKIKSLFFQNQIKTNKHYEFIQKKVIRRFTGTSSRNR